MMLPKFGPYSVKPWPFDYNQETIKWNDGLFLIIWALILGPWNSFLYVIMFILVAKWHIVKIGVI